MLQPLGLWGKIGRRSIIENVGVHAMNIYILQTILIVYIRYIYQYMIYIPILGGVENNAPQRLKENIIPLTNVLTHFLSLIIISH